MFRTVTITVNEVWFYIVFAVAFLGWFCYFWEAHKVDSLRQQIKDLQAHIKKIWKYSREEMK